MRRPSTAALLLGFLAFAAAAQAQEFRQTNLVSDVSGLALHTDSHLVNPWGLVPGPSGVFWTSNNGTGTSTLDQPDGTPLSLVVTIPGGGNTGVVLAAASDSSFRIPSGDSTARAVFIFVTEDGTVAAWSPLVDATNAIQVADVDGAHYTGAAIGGTQSEPRLYAANFAARRIDVFDRNFAVVTPPGSFTDPGLPDGYAPFNVANVNGELFVAYAQVDPSTHEEMAGPGLGIVSVFDSNGVFLRRFTTGGSLNAPWAVVQAPPGFGPFGGSILVGNFGDGRIDAFDSGGSFQGALLDTLGNPLSISGLWGLHFGLPVSGAGVAQRLYFAAGIEDESHGLFGFLSEFSGGGGGGGGGGGEVCANDSRGVGFWRHLCGGPSHPGGNGGGNGHGHGDGEDGHGHGNGHDDQSGGRGHGHDPAVSPDSLDALFACIGSAGAPNAFGSGGCFTAGCDLLQKVGKRTVREDAAQELLTLRLNLCSGLVCDSAIVACGDRSAGLTVGDVADSMDVLLCTEGASDADLRALTGLLACANEAGDDDEEGDDDSGRLQSQRKLDVHTIGASPVHLGGGSSLVEFAVTAAEPQVVRLRVYDALGRLVAEPLRGSFVIGTASVKWDGRDQRGALVTPGSYFYRATSGTSTATGKFVVIR